MLVGRGESEVNVIQADQAWFFTFAYLDISVLLFFFLTGMQTWIIAVNENVYTLRLTKRATCLSRGRKRVWFCSLRVAVDESGISFYSIHTVQPSQAQNNTYWVPNCLKLEHLLLLQTFDSYASRAVTTSVITSCDGTTTTPKYVSSDKCYTARQLGTWKCFTSLKDVPTYAYISKRACFKSVHSTNKTGLQNTQLGDAFLFTNAIRNTKSWSV
jgi:hypothetical protein